MKGVVLLGLRGPCATEAQPRATLPTACGAAPSPGRILATFLTQCATKAIHAGGELACRTTFRSLNLVLPLSDTARIIVGVFKNQWRWRGSSPLWRTSSGPSKGLPVNPTGVPREAKGCPCGPHLGPQACLCGPGVVAGGNLMAHQAAITGAPYKPRNVEAPLTQECLKM